MIYSEGTVVERVWFVGNGKQESVVSRCGERVRHLHPACLATVHGVPAAIVPCGDLRGDYGVHSRRRAIHV